MNQKLTQNTRPWCYWLLLASQSAGAGIVLWQGVPIYRRLLLGTPDTGPRLSVMLWALLAMALIQPAYWVARRHSPAVGHVPRPVLGHVVQFLGRLTIIYLGGMFGAVFYVRYQELQLAVWRELMLVAVLFSVFCYTKELERLGLALMEPPGPVADVR
jgi:hypothetical protein